MSKTNQLPNRTEVARLLFFIVINDKSSSDPYHVLISLVQSECMEVLIYLHLRAKVGLTN